MAPNVIPLRPNQNRDSIAALEILLDLAKNNRLKGMVLTAETDAGIGLYLAGRHQNDLALAAAAIAGAYRIVHDMRVEEARGSGG